MHDIYLSLTHDEPKQQHVGSSVNASNFNSGGPDLNLGQKPTVLTEGFHGFPNPPGKCQDSTLCYGTTSDLL
jgi:hypothetical protein